MDCTLPIAQLAKLTKQHGNLVYRILSEPPACEHAQLMAFDKISTYLHIKFKDSFIFAHPKAL